MKRNNEDSGAISSKKTKKNDQEKEIDLSDMRPDSMHRLKCDFFDQECLDLCKHLIGKYLVRKTNDEQNCLVGRIVEVEGYTGPDDPASHSFKKQTDRNKAMFMKPGTAYVYNIYGCYCCINISSREPGAAVLIRALEPVYGHDQMSKNKNLVSKGKKKTCSDKNLTNGPSKLCMSLNITKNLFNQVDLAESKDLWLQDRIDLVKSNIKIVSAKRIGIDYAGQDAINKLWRFYIKDNKHVSILSKESVELD